MDCVISGPSSVRLFCSSISCLSKIGRDLYLEQDVASGVVLRALNDARSAYCSMRFSPAFFERCGAATSSGGGGRSNSRTGGGSGGDDASSLRRRQRRRPPNHHMSSPSHPSASSHSQSTNGVLSVRMAMRAMLPVVKPRRDAVQLRITSVAVAADDDDHEEASLGSSASKPFRLAFEFLVVRRTNDGGGGAATAGATGSGRPRGQGRANYRGSAHGSAHSNDDTLIRIVHRIPAADADAVSAVLNTSAPPSEIVCPPRALLRLLEPLSRFKDVTEVALVVQGRSQVLTAQSFHHADRYRVVVQQQHNNNNDTNGGGPTPTWQWVQRGRDAARVVKTEASMSVDELERFAFQDDRPQKQQQPLEEEDDNNNQDIDDTLDAPDHVNDGVVLVFPVREARAFLQFGAAFGPPGPHSSSAAVLGGASSPAALDSAVVRFHWGGKPVVMELTSTSSSFGGASSSHTSDGGGGSGSGRGLSRRGEEQDQEDDDDDVHRLSRHFPSSPAPFAAQLVLASLDHRLLADRNNRNNDDGDNENENEGENTMRH